LDLLDLRVQSANKAVKEKLEIKEQQLQVQVPKECKEFKVRKELKAHQAHQVQPEVLVQVVAQVLQVQLDHKVQRDQLVLKALPEQQEVQVHVDQSVKLA
jgi:hypothetical protein